MGSTRFATRASGLLVPRPQFFQGACPCCGTPTCDIFSDDFTRSDSTNIGSDWTETSGDWSIASNKLSIAATNSIALCNTAHPDGNSELSISVSVSSSTSGDLARILIDYQDSSNYKWAEWKSGGAGYIKVGKVVAGASTTLATGNVTTSTATTYTWVFCSNGIVIASIINSVTANAAESTSNPNFALGTGGTCAGSFTYDNLVVNKVEDGCGLCGACSLCPENPLFPQQVQAVASGFTGCGGTCPSLDGTYILDLYRPASLFTNVACVWTYQLPSTICNLNYLQFWRGTSGYSAGFSRDGTQDNATDILIRGAVTPDSTNCLDLASFSISMSFNLSSCSTAGTISITAI